MFFFFHDLFRASKKYLEREKQTKKTLTYEIIWKFQKKKKSDHTMGSSPHHLHESFLTHSFFFPPKFIIYLTIFSGVMETFFIYLLHL